MHNHLVRIKRADGGDGTTCPIGMCQRHAPAVNRGEQRDDDGLQIIAVESEEQGDFPLSGGQPLADILVHRNEGHSNIVTLPPSRGHVATAIVVNAGGEEHLDGGGAPIVPPL